MNDILVLRDFHGIVEVTGSEVKAHALAMAAAVVAVTDDATQAAAVAAKRELKTIRTQVEATRKSIKAPIVALGKDIDAKANDFMAELEAEEKRIDAAINTYQAAVLAAAEAKRREAEAAARKAEADRQAAEAAQRKAEQDAKDAEERALKAKSAKAREKAEAEAAAAREKALDAELLAESAAVASQPPAVVEEKTQGVSARKTLDYRVIGETEMEQAASLLRLATRDLSLVNITPRRSDILDAINRRGISDLPGLLIFEAVRTTVR